MRPIIYHNPKCGTSRTTLAMLKQAGTEPEVIEYLKTPPSRETLEKLINDSGLSVRAVLRKKDTLYEGLSLGDHKWTDAQLIDFMLNHPILMNRPIVVTSKGTRLCRPSDVLLEILDEAQVRAVTGEESKAAFPQQEKRISETGFDLSDLPELVAESFHPIKSSQLESKDAPDHPPRILLLYGSLRKRSFSRFAVQEAQRILEQLGAETRIFNPTGLPLPDDAEPDHPKVQELRQLMTWSEGQVWCSPERHGSMTGIMKSMIDWVPLSMGAVRPTQGKTLALMQVCGGSQSFNAVNQMRQLGRWMRMITIPNQSSVPKAFLEFNENGRMKPSSKYDRIVDVMEELMKFTHLTRGHAEYLTDRYSERKETAKELSQRVNQKQAC